MIVDLKDRESIVLQGKRIINDAGRTIRLVILDERGEQIQVDRRKYPKPTPKAKPAAIDFAGRQS